MGRRSPGGDQRTERMPGVDRNSVELQIHDYHYIGAPTSRLKMYTARSKRPDRQSRPLHTQDGRARCCPKGTWGTMTCGERSRRGFFLMEIVSG